MGQYFFKMNQAEKNDILDQHKKIYDGYVTEYGKTSNQQPLYVQDFANDKNGLVVNNKGDVKHYTNMNINESELPLDMIGDGEDDLVNGTVNMDEYISLGSKSSSDCGCNHSELSEEDDQDWDELSEGWDDHAMKYFFKDYDKKDYEWPVGVNLNSKGYEGEELFYDDSLDDELSGYDEDIQLEGKSNLNEKKPCWAGYKQVGMKQKGGKEVPNCVPINENDVDRDSSNYMFWQNLKTIRHSADELLNMNQDEVDELCLNGHAWAVDHVATSSDDMEEVYHFFDSIKDEVDEDDYEDVKSNIQESLNYFKRLSKFN